MICNGCGISYVDPKMVRPIDGLCPFCAGAALEAEDSLRTPDAKLIADAISAMQKGRVNPSTGMPLKGGKK